ncbi:MAG TPA: CHASE2 domain-containing protein [Spirochaetia bacterium]|nr:CHASE2 domain-containing protein [Spirochaetia bacterium]
MKNRLDLQLLVPFAVALVFIVLGVVGVFKTFDNRIYDTFLHIKPEIPQSKSIMLVDVDDTSIAKVGVWPWSRNIMADGLVTMREFGAAYAVFDIEYVNQSPLGVNGSYLDKTIPQLFNQQFQDINQNVTGLFAALAQGQISMKDAQDYVTQLTGLNDESKKLLLTKVQDIARDNDTYLGEAAWYFKHAFFTNNFTSSPEQVSPEYEKWIMDNISLKNVTVHGNYGHVTTGLSPAIQPILSRAAGAGFPRVVVDGDGVRRRVNLVYQYNGKYFGQLVFRPLLSYLGDPAIDLYPNKIVLENAKLPGETLRTISIPLTPNGYFMINWPKTDYNHSFSHMSYYQLVLFQQQEDGLMTLLHAMSDANYLSFYQGGSTFFAPYDEADQIKQAILKGGNPDQIAQVRSLRETFFASVGDFLSGNAAKGILSQIDTALASPQITADQTKQFTSIRNDVEAKFKQTKDLYKAYMESRSILSKDLEGKICIIGNTATSSTDLGVNPFVEQYANVGTHASIANTILNSRFINVLPEWYALLAGFLLCFIMYFSVRTLEPLQSIIVGAAIILVFLGAAVGLFLTFRLYLGMSVPTISVVVTYLTLIVLKFLVTSREKSYIRNAFGRYLSGDVINELLANPDKLALGGDKKVLTAFFTDIRGFSSISEHLDPSDLVRLLNAYLTEMSDIILGLRGTIDKYEGDAIISFFGAPVEFEGHADNACRAALGMKRAETILNERFMSEKLSPQPLLTRIGINTGEMVVGNMGTANKMDYTIMGNAVNLASRLEGVNKQYGTWILASEITRQSCGDEFIFRMLDRVRVVGIREPVRLYEVLGERGEGSGSSEELVERFHSALVLFEAKQWKEAKAAFAEVLKLDKDDGPSLTFNKRCDDYIKTAPPPNWDGVFNLGFK